MLWMIFQLKSDLSNGWCKSTDILYRSCPFDCSRKNDWPTGALRAMKNQLIYSTYWRSQNKHITGAGKQGSETNKGTQQHQQQQHNNFLVSKGRVIEPAGTSYYVDTSFFFLFLFPRFALLCLRYPLKLCISMAGKVEKKPNDKALYSLDLVYLSLSSDIGVDFA